MDINMATIGGILRQFKIDEWLFMQRLAGGNHHAAFVLRKVILWNATSTAQERDGWFHKSHSQMGKETGLSPYQIRKAQGLIEDYVETKLDWYKGKEYTWYRLNPEAILNGISKLLSKMTGKIFDLIKGVIGSEPVKKLRDCGLKNFTRQTLTFNNSDQLDDDFFNLPLDFRKFAFKGIRDDTRLISEIERIGEARALATIERCIKNGGEWWSYIWTSLSNEPDAGEAPVEASTGAPVGNASWLARMAADVVNRESAEDVPLMASVDPDFDLRAWQEENRDLSMSWAERQTVPASEAVETEVREGMTLRRAFELAWSQLELQFDKTTFFTWFRDVRLVDYRDNTVIMQVPNEYAEEKINGRYYRNVRRVISDVLNRTVELRAVVEWGVA